MRILVDADACPVKKIIVRVARARGIPVLMLIDTAHELDDGYSEVIMVDCGRDSVDYALLARIGPGDLAVTQDYGLAALVLAKGAYAIHPTGMVYDAGNIGGLLEERARSARIRRAGGRTKGPPKRTAEDDIRFEQRLVRVLDRAG